MMSKTSIRSQGLQEMEVVFLSWLEPSVPGGAAVLCVPFRGLGSPCATSNSPGLCCDLRNCDGVGQQDEERGQAEGSPGPGWLPGSSTHLLGAAFRRHGGPLCAAAGSSRSTGKESRESREHQTHHTRQRLGHWGCLVGGVTGELALRLGFHSEIQRH